VTARPTHVSTKSHIDALNLRTHRVILWVVTRHQPETVYEWYAALLREQRARERQEPLVCLTHPPAPERRLNPHQVNEAPPQVSEIVASLVKAPLCQPSLLHLH
jgi:hypothetical protein